MLRAATRARRLPGPASWRRLLCASAGSEHEGYLRDVAAATPPDELPALLQVLQLSGESLVSPEDRSGLHPFLVPLTRRPDGAVTGLLRWPRADGGRDLVMNLPVVSMRRGAKSMTLLAPSARHSVTRMAATRDAMLDERASEFLDAAKSAGIDYEAGTVEAAGIGLQRYLLIKVGPFPDLYEQFAIMHCRRGDMQAGLVTSDRMCTLFSSWGRALWFTSRLYARLHREEEAKETARLALEVPLWTLEVPLAEVARAAGYPDNVLTDLRTVLRIIDDSEAAQKELSQEEIAERKARLALDLACVHEDQQWAGVAAEAADHFADAGLGAFAEFVRSVPT